MSALPPKADIGTQSLNVCFVPKADIDPSHSITSSVTASSEDGTVMPSIRAVAALIINSSLLD